MAHLSSRKNSKYYAVLLGDKGDPAFARKLKNSTKPVIKKTFAEQYDTECVEFDFILEYVLSAMIGVMSYWFKRDKVLPAEELIMLMYDLMETGVTGRLSSKITASEHATSTYR